jgi:8-hydroxy-5-deazaflavin:NADPH oxidoreductase
MDVAIVGGTGAEGFGLALRLATAGHGVRIGSRDAARGEEAAIRASERAGATLTGSANDDAVAEADVVVLTVPFAGLIEICRSIAPAVPARAVVLDATSPLATAVGGRPWQVLRPWAGSAAETVAGVLGNRERVVAGLHTIAAKPLQDLERPIESDVLLCGDDPDAKATAGSLVESIPNLRWVDCGGLEMARIAEQLTALLVSVNRTYHLKDAGFRIVGRDSWGPPGG